VKYAATFSGIALAASISTLMYVDKQNDQDLVNAVAAQRVLDQQAQASALKRVQEQDEALLRASCATSAESRNIVNLAFNYIGSLARQSPARDDFLAWLERCIPPRDCAVSLVAIPIPDDCAVSVPVAPNAPEENPP
jgi:type II secretory pathway pseudopilin PulG